MVFFGLTGVAVESREDESFNYFVTTAYPPRVYNDVFIIRDAQNYMIKLSISHAIAQSVKVPPFIPPLPLIRFIPFNPL